ncbi:permease [Pseudoalteromonas sp. MMG022]|uniref:permease n=1 Tax=Pseudoalteromonas sp. MMG022 TaxID=2909978 RepID=UPI001F16B70C|nr:permease [Pseudoalteromonas sp. MMG022]MCF6437244.1 permease [Pseudoalteromonas sp. MMG022]
MFTYQQWQSALTFFVSTFAELTVLFLVISFIVSVVNHYLPTAKVRQLLSGNSGYSVAIGLGAVTPFCSCSTLPMMVGLLKARAAFGPVMAFLFTSPLLNPFIIALLWATFGASITLCYAFFAVTMALLSGILMQRFGFERFIREELFACPSNETGKASNETTCQTNPSSSCVPQSTNKPQPMVPFIALCKSAFKQLTMMLPYMAIGVAVGAALHGFVPTELFSALADVHLLLMIPLCAMIGTFLYVRASTMIPIAASLVAKGLSLGAVMSLTIAGAGASLPEMIMLKKLFHWPLLIAFITLVFTTACLTGLGIELLNLR